MTVPLAALNQLRESRFDWLSPGLLREKIEELIRSLPKNLRTQFVPGADVAREAAATLRPGDGSLAEALAIYLSKRSGVIVPPSAFDSKNLPEHLRMNFKVVAADGKTVAAGRDLEKIRISLGRQATQTFADLPQSDFNRDNITGWNFGVLAEKRRNSAPWNESAGVSGAG